MARELEGQSGLVGIGGKREQVTKNVKYCSPITLQHSSEKTQKSCYREQGRTSCARMTV
jgi:hypothetical protein